MAKMEFLHDGDFYGTLSASQGVYDGTVRVYSTNNNPSLSTLGGSIIISQISATGTPSSSTYLRGDGTWSVTSGGSGSVVTGLLSASPSSVITITNGTSAVVGAGTGITISQATTSTAGYVSSADWNTFNSKASTASLSAYIPYNTSGTFSLSGHTHSLSALNGTLPISMISATGTPSSTTYLRGDGSWTATSGSTIATSGLNDVSAVAPLNGQTLVYSSANSKYIPSKGSSIDFGEFTDIIMPGLNWTSANSTNGSPLMYSVAYGGGMFVGLDYTSATNIISYDGVNWTSASSVSGLYTGCRAITYGNGMWVSTLTSNVVLYSQDGINWTSASAPTTNGNAICYGNGQFVITCYNTANVMTSPNGINWTLRNGVLPESPTWIAIAYGNGVYITVANAGGSNRLARSVDGITWTAPSNPLSANTCGGVAYGNGVFVVASYNGTSKFATSVDGLVWTERTVPVLNSWRQVTYGGGLFVVVGSTGTKNRIMTSPDGITWTSRSTPVDNTWLPICYGDGVFVAGSSDGTGNRIMYSGRKRTNSNSSDRFINNTQVFNNGIVVSASSIMTSLGVNGLSGTSDGIVKATSAGILNRQSVYTGNVYSASVSATSTSWDCSVYDTSDILLSGSGGVTILLTNLAVGAKYQMTVRQGSVNRAITLSATGYTFKCPGGSIANAFSTSINTIDMASMAVTSAGEVLAVISKAFA